MDKMNTPRGRPVSGRVWKSVAKPKRDMQFKALKVSWNKRLQQQKEKEVLKAVEREMREEKEKKKQVSLKKQKYNRKP